MSGWSVEDDLIEAIELPGNERALGVLWHPEEDPGDATIGWLAALASDRERAA